MQNIEVIKKDILNKIKDDYPGNTNIELAIDKKLDYKNDAFFKYVLTRSSHIRNIMCSHILPEDIKLKETTVIDSHLYKQNEHDKPGIVDIAAIDDLGNNYNIEMQCYNITPSDFKRFQFYAYKSLASHLDIKDDYMKLNPIYQLIINGSGKDAGNLNHFEIYDKYYDTSLPHSLYYTNYIQLHHQDEIENKEKLNIFLEAMLAFQNNGNTDIIDSEVVKEINQMYDDFTRSAEIINAVRDEINRMYWDVKMDEAREEGEDLGYQRGHQQGVQEGMQQGNDSARLNDIKAVMDSLNCDLEKAMDVLHLDLSQKEKYKQLLDTQ